MKEHDMIERVARAIADANMEDYGELKELHDALARAAIEAMRVPADAMLDAACELYLASDHDYRIIYQAMIDAALREHV
jgi:hypothetical protein